MEPIRLDTKQSKLIYGEIEIAFDFVLLKDKEIFVL